MKIDQSVQAFKILYAEDYKALFEILEVEHPDKIDIFTEAKIIINAILKYMYRNNKTAIARSLVAFSIYFVSKMKLKEASKLLGTNTPCVAYATQQVFDLSPQPIKNLGPTKFKYFLRDGRLDE